MKKFRVFTFFFPLLGIIGNTFDFVPENIPKWKKVFADFFEFFRNNKIKFTPQDFEPFLQLLPLLKNLTFSEIKSRLFLTFADENLNPQQNDIKSTGSEVIINEDDSSLDAFLKDLQEEEEITDRGLTKTPPKKYVYILAGHGGINPKTGEYTTRPSKMYYHKDLNLHAGGLFYEGVFNREITAIICKELDKMNIPYKSNHLDWEDKPLASQIREVNNLNDVAFILSIHSNAAASEKANGITVFVGKNAGQKSKAIATDLAKNLQNHCHEFNFPKQTRNLYWQSPQTLGILEKTKHPSVLSESGFFTNKKDVQLMVNPVILDKIAAAHVATILNFMKADAV